MSDMKVRIDELKKTIDQAAMELKKLTDQVNTEKGEEWVGLFFKVVRQHIIIDGKTADRLISYYQINDFNRWYLQYYGVLVEVAEDWGKGSRRVKIHSEESVDPQWLIQHGEVLSRAEFRVEIEDLLRYVLPFRVELPPRPAVEDMCPCPDCMRCCCGRVEGLDENRCVNFEEFRRCICEHADDDQAAISDERQSGQENLIILWLGMDEYEEFAGTLEEAIASVNVNRRWDNYGRTGAVIVKAEKLYEIKNDVVEFFGEERAPIVADEEVEAEIKEYERKFGMSSEEFLEQVRLGTAPDEAGIIDWKLLLKYR